MPSVGWAGIQDKKLVTLYDKNKKQLDLTTRTIIEADIEKLRTIVLSTESDRNILNLLQTR